MFRCILSLGLLVVIVSAEFCTLDVKRTCSHPTSGVGIQNCSSKFSGIASKNYDLQHYAAMHIQQNFNYLLMSAYFNNYEANREGFSKLYRKMADEAWEDSLDLIKYMAKRGFNMDYNVKPRPSVQVTIDSFEMHELQSLASALDMQKKLAEEGHHIHAELSGHNKNHDAEAVQYIEEKFVGKHAEKIHELAGYANDLHKLIVGNNDPSFAIYMFDDHLKSLVG